MLSCQKTAYCPSFSLPIISKPAGYKGHFSSGPCSKPIDFKPPTSFIDGRSHRAKEPLLIFQDLLTHLKILLELPEDYRLLLVPGSCSGSMDMALWNFLGPRPVCALEWDVFSRMWTRHVKEELKLPIRILNFEDLLQGKSSDSEEDVIFSWTGTTSGLSMNPNHDFITQKRKGLTICDGAASVFCTPMPWEYLDVTCFSFQKALSGEAGFGLMILSPKAMERLEQYTPTWPMTRLSRLKSHTGGYLKGLEYGETINTPSLWLLEENRNIVHYWLNKGGLKYMLQKTEENKILGDSYCSSKEYSNIEDFTYRRKNNTSDNVSSLNMISPFLYCVSEKSWQSKTPLLFMPPLHHEFHKKNTKEKWTFIKETAGILEEAGLMYDITNHIFDIPSFRLWIGPSIEKDYLKFALEVLKQWCA